MKRAYVSEIYASFQGEGPYTGERQIFVRLAGCPLRCRYCDTPGSLTARGHTSMTVAEVLKRVKALRRSNGAQTVSLTGGEPLAQAAFLADLAPQLRSSGFRVYLETAGVHPDALRRVIEDCDVVAMDVKLPSATGRSFWREHAAFLAVASSKAFVKVVVDGRTRSTEIRRVAGLLSRQRPVPLLVLQTASAVPTASVAPSVDQIARAYAEARKKLSGVLVMPQQHKLWGVP